MPPPHFQIESHIHTLPQSILLINTFRMTNHHFAESFLRSPQLCLALHRLFDSIGISLLLINSSDRENSFSTFRIFCLGTLRERNEEFFSILSPDFVLAPENFKFLSRQKNMRLSMYKRLSSYAWHYPLTAGPKMCGILTHAKR